MVFPLNLFVRCSCFSFFQEHWICIRIYTMNTLAIYSVAWAACLDLSMLTMVVDPVALKSPCSSIGQTTDSLWHNPKFHLQQVTAPIRYRRASCCNSIETPSGDSIAVYNVPAVVGHTGFYKRRRNVLQQNVGDGGGSGMGCHVLGSDDSPNGTMRHHIFFCNDESRGLSGTGLFGFPQN